MHSSHALFRHAPLLLLLCFIATLFGACTKPASTRSPSGYQPDVLIYIRDWPSLGEDRHCAFRVAILGTGRVVKCGISEDRFPASFGDVSEGTFRTLSSSIRKLDLLRMKPCAFLVLDSKSVEIGIWVNGGFQRYMWSGLPEDLPESIRPAFQAAWNDAMELAVDLSNVQWHPADHRLIDEVRAMLP